MAEKITDETLVTTSELAGVLGITARRVNQLAQDNVVPTEEKGKFALCESVQRYIRYVSDAEFTEEEREIERNRRKAEMQIKAAKAVVAKLEAQELQGKMHRSEDVESITGEMVTTLRNMLLALPGRLAVDVTNAVNSAEAANIIRTEIYKVMEEMARFQYDPAKYEERVRDRQNWEQREQTGDE